MNKPTQNFGFLRPVIKKDDKFLGQGNLPRIVLQEDGFWGDSLPVGEVQAHGALDSINCTAFKTLDQIEMYEKKAFGEVNNYSERWVGIIAGTTARGNDPSKVYEAIEKYGLIPEEMLPWSDDIQNLDEYFSFKGGNEAACYAEGRKWKAKKDFMHNWVFRADQPLAEKINNMKIALRFSPLAFDVAAWEKNADGKYYRFGNSGHWTTCYGIREFIDVFNSYVPFVKELVMDFNFFYCKRISITLKAPLSEEKSNLIMRLLQAIGEALGLIQKQVEQLPKPVPNLPIMTPNLPIKEPTVKERLAKACKEGVGLDISPKDNAPDELACSESISVLLDEVLPKFPVILSTSELRKVLNKDKRFRQTKLLKPWSVILCATGSGNGELKNGHVGILGENDVIYSNNSLRGKWDSHWRLTTWVEYYRGKGGFPILLYELT